MHRISSRLSKTSSSFSTLITNASKRTLTTHSPATPNLQKLQQPTIPNHFLKWGSLGFVRTSRFVTRFSPLEPKPLDSIMDIQRAKDKSPEDLASIWDDDASRLQQPPNSGYGEAHMAGDFWHRGKGRGLTGDWRVSSPSWCCWRRRGGYDDEAWRLVVISWWLCGSTVDWRLVE